VGPVNDVRAALEDPQVAARGLVVEVDHPSLAPIRTPVTAVRVGSASVDRKPGLVLAEHTEEMLRDLLGYDAGTMARLEAQGTFGTPGMECRRPWLVVRSAG